MCITLALRKATLWSSAGTLDKVFIRSFSPLHFNTLNFFRALGWPSAEEITCNPQPHEATLCSPEALTISKSILIATSLLVPKLFEYSADPVQMKFLRLLSKRVSQNVTYHCYNSRAWEVGQSIKLKGDNEMELTASTKTKPTVVKNECQVCTFFSVLELFVSETRLKMKCKTQKDFTCF